jgi:hypothetical protein
MSEEEPLTFLASIAPLDSAIQVSSHGGARFKIDLPESELPAIVRLLLLRGMTLRFTVEVEESLTFGSAETDNRTKERPTRMARSRVQRPTD